MLKKKIAIVGASYLQLPLVVKARQMGCEVFCFAWNEGAVCKDVAHCFFPISIIEKQEILAVCEEHKVDGVISIASDVATPTVSYVAEKLNLVGNSRFSSIISTNKYEMRRRFTEFGVNSPLFFQDDDVDKINQMQFPCIVKPVDRSGSLGVMKVEKLEDLRGTIENAKFNSFSKHAIIEEFIEGREVSVEAISWNGKHYILAITDKVTTGEPYFVELEHHQPSDLDKSIQNKIKLMTEKALDALEIKFGASHSEFKVTEGGDVYAIEVGGRMGGDFIGSDLVHLSTGYDFLAGVINVALGKFEIPLLKNKQFSGVYFLSKETENLLGYFDKKSKDKRIVQIEKTSSDLRNIMCSADRSGYFIYQSNEKMKV